MGNSKARAVYEANIPDSFRRPQTDSSLEAFIRSKYEHKKYIAKEWVPPQVPKQPTWVHDLDKKKDKKKVKTPNPAADLPPPVALPKPVKGSGSPSAVSSISESQPAEIQAKPVSNLSTDLLGLGKLNISLMVFYNLNLKVRSGVILWLSGLGVRGRGVPGRVPAGTNETSRPFCPGARMSRQTPNWPGQWDKKKKRFVVFGAKNYTSKLIVFLSTK